MTKIAAKLTDLIGNTPLLELNQLGKLEGANAHIIAKIESFNPLGSVKDRIALSMVEEAEKSGVLKEGSIIIEPTSGNTGIGLAFVATIKNYRLILTMPETMSLERRNLLKALGAELVLTPGAEGMKGAIAKAKDLKSQLSNAVILQQFENHANPAIHYSTTGEEIWRDTDGKVDILVSGIGTGGTASGAGKRLKELNSAIKVVAVEPTDSAILSGGSPGPHKIQGIGAGFIPDTYDKSVIDQVFTVTNDDAILTSRKLASQEGLLAGISSGAAVYAAIQLSKQPENAGKNIVVILPDTGERYLSTVLYSFDEYPL